MHRCLSYNPHTNAMAFAIPQNHTTEVLEGLEGQIRKLHEVNGNITHLTYNPNPHHHHVVLSIDRGITAIVDVDNSSSPGYRFTQRHDEPEFISNTAAYNSDGTLLAIPQVPNLIHIYQYGSDIPFENLTAQQITFLALTSKLQATTQRIISAYDHPLASDAYRQLSQYRSLQKLLAQRWHIDYTDPLPETAPEIE